ncbi:uncharacterized protein KY384_007654 [Bacidia gigantensis]|uniref:uncharacterized protein n=1 Tax=Bacidia gigantensis TaxID=2732470 RepID=UPI001D050006|nr:uncharacterized protein KY384_007654 [Bacidia gigantensis]KAG8527502.1 hypothetical protein KY384_007654 [Bacidia gigantensis]
MARQARRRICYVLPLANSPGGHRLGVNGLAVDAENSILYSGGRDGLICAWDLDVSITHHEGLVTPLSQPSTFRDQVQAHTHWVNDILLARSNSALVSASSDISVKVWRPHAEEIQMPTTIGLHSDYVKCLASAGSHTDWVASGGLDHKIRLWDLNGHGEKLQIDTGESESSSKGSVYALSVRGSVMASGGPESIVRLWDPRTGKRITKFVGHTDNIRDILINQDGDRVMTASSDQSIKVWSVTAGRCMYTLTMHNDSVWSLHSDHPNLSVFYSSDRSGLVAKTDVRHCDDMDEGLSIAIAQEQEGVNKIAVAGDCLWTATSSSSINRWDDVDTTGQVQPNELPRHQRVSSIASRTKVPSPPSNPGAVPVYGQVKAKIPISCVLRVSNNAPIPGETTRDMDVATIYSSISARKASEAFIDHELGNLVPYHELPAETIEGQHGLIKHVLLNDRRRVLTLDTAGEVTLWDLISCKSIKSFGKRHLDEVRPEVDTVESIVNWCAVDTRTGRLAVVLDKNDCFDAEAYADELGLENSEYFREDQRINLGKWVLRYLFAKLIEEETEKDLEYRMQLVPNASSFNTDNLISTRPPIRLPGSPPTLTSGMNQDDAVTPKAINGISSTSATSIGTSAPQSNGMVVNSTSQMVANGTSTIEEASKLEKQPSQASAIRGSMDRPADLLPNDLQANVKVEDQAKALTSPAEANESSATVSSNDNKDERPGSTLFGKKFRMNFPRKLARSSVEVKPAVVDEKSEESDRFEDKDEKSSDSYFLGTILGIKKDYEVQLHDFPNQEVISGISPSTEHDTPRLKHPPYTTVIIQEETPEAGGVADIYRGTVSSVGSDAHMIERRAPSWLGDVLLKNQLPDKEPTKVSFVLLPHEDLLPSIASADGNTRLTANRMLRAKKVLAYVSEKIETTSMRADASALKPEEYLDLYCQNQLVEHNMTLATLRTHIWKTGGDVVMYYRSNGMKPELEQMISEKAAAASAAETSGKVGPIIPG